MGIEKGKTPPTLIYSADEYVWYICNIDVTYFSTKSEMFFSNCMYVLLLHMDHIGVRIQI